MLPCRSTIYVRAAGGLRGLISRLRHCWCVPLFWLRHPLDLHLAPVKIDPHVFPLLWLRSGAAACISCQWLSSVRWCRTVECLFSAESLTMFTSIKLSFFPGIWEAVRMGRYQCDYSRSCLSKTCDQDVSPFRPLLRFLNLVVFQMCSFFRKTGLCKIKSEI